MDGILESIAILKKKPELADFFKQIYAEMATGKSLTDKDIQVLSQALRSVEEDAYLQKYKERIVAGFLELGPDKGWQVSGNPALGRVFVRRALSTYLNTATKMGNDERAIFRQVLESLESGGSKPINRVSCLDPQIIGWDKHVVSRVVGRLDSLYSKRSPLFEVIVNSQPVKLSDSQCNPFHVTVYWHQLFLDQRREELLACHTAAPEQAVPVFYSLANECTAHWSPENYLKTYKQKLSPEAKRSLAGLIFLKEKRLAPQTVGNCWLIQPMRSLLVNLFFQVFSSQENLEPAEAWGVAEKLYLQWQNDAALPKVAELLQECSVDTSQRVVAEAAYQKRLLSN